MITEYRPNTRPLAGLYQILPRNSEPCVRPLALSAWLHWRDSGTFLALWEDIGGIEPPVIRLRARFHRYSPIFAVRLVNCARQSLVQAMSEELLTTGGQFPQRLHLTERVSAIYAAHLRLLIDWYDGTLTEVETGQTPPTSD
jgi:hypothetical protein